MQKDICIHTYRISGLFTGYYFVSVAWKHGVQMTDLHVGFVFVFHYIRKDRGDKQRVRLTELSVALKRLKCTVGIVETWFWNVFAW